MYRDFEKIILDFQLKEHERFLQKFNWRFKRFDSDQDGILNEQQFKDLANSLGVLNNEKEVENLLHLVDPYNNKRMTYSELVSMFSQHMV